MGMFDGLEKMFSFKSKEQLEKERLEFEARIFPLGVEETRARILEALRPYFRKKADTTEILYPFLMAKQQYLDQTPLEDIARAVKKSAFRVGDTEARAVLALVLLEQDAGSIADYPTAQEVEKKMPEIAL
ncbi:MAG: hypothetical protein VB021_04945 [Oscillospiraceae bacterium]|nr:hypothetical protein [Oscillospiraceae bacterium]